MNRIALLRTNYVTGNYFHADPRDVYHRDGLRIASVDRHLVLAVGYAALIVSAVNQYDAHRQLVAAARLALIGLDRDGPASAATVATTLRAALAVVDQS